MENAIAVQGETRDDTGTTEGEDPVRVVTHGSLRANLTRLVRDNNDSEGTDGVGDVVRAVTEGVTARSQDLKPAHAQLRLLVKLLSVGMDSVNSHVFIENILSLVVQRSLKMILNGVEDAHRSAKNTNRVFTRLSDNLFFNLLTRSTLSLVGLLLVVKFFRFPQNHRCDEKVRKNTGGAANAECDGARSSNGSILQTKVRRALVHDEENVDDESSAKHDREHDGSAREGVLRSQDESSKYDEHAKCETSAHDG